MSALIALLVVVTRLSANGLQLSAIHPCRTGKLPRSGQYHSEGPLDRYGESKLISVAAYSCLS